ncbi:MAG TPA: mechanosensitive ion channel family protein, partial [Verrucomicrobiota bacterium]|nr:mechanosensitive ion channel family protein [Verrucomicrobiota bacterium]
ILTMASNLGVDITSILTLGSVGALAVSLAAQDLLGNIFGGIAILVDKPFVIGDAVKVENRDGTVETIGLRSTRIRTYDGFLVTIPNKTMANSTIANVTCRPTIKTEINVGITYDTTTEQLRKALDIANDVYANYRNTQDVIVSFNKFGDFALNIQIVHWHNPTPWADYVKSIEAMNLELKKRFDSEGINFAFPTQTIYLKQE